MISALNYKLEQTVTVEKSGQCAYKLNLFLKIMGGRDHTTGEEICQSMSNS